MRLFSSRHPMRLGRRSVWAILAVGFLAVLSAGCRPGGRPPKQTDDSTGDPETTAREVVERMAKAYQQCLTYSDRAVVDLQYKVQGRTIHDRATLAITFDRSGPMALEVSRGDYRVSVAGDGTTLNARIEHPDTNDFDLQVVERPAPEKLTLAALYSATELVDPVGSSEMVSALLGTPVRLELSQLGLLLEDASWPDRLRRADRIELLSDDKVRDNVCHRVCVVVDDRRFVFWIDRESSLLRRLEYPVDDLFPSEEGDDPPPGASLVADFVDAQFDGALPADSFVIEKPPGAQVVRYFVLPPQRLPSGLIGKTVDEMSFVGLDGKAIGSDQWRGRSVLLVWFQDHPACREALAKVEQVYRKHRDDDRIAFVAVCSSPAALSTDKQVGQLVKDWNVTMPVVRDQGAVGRDTFHIDVEPTLIVLDSDNVVQLFDTQVAENPAVAEDLSAALDRLLSGDNLAERFLEHSRQQQAAFQRHLEAAGLEGIVSMVELPITAIANRDEPRTLELKRLWTCDALQQPGNILVVPDDDGRPDIFVLDGWRTVAGIDAQGQLIGTHVLPLPEGAAVSTLRTAVDGRGRRLFTAIARKGRQVHVFDADWKLLLSYPDSQQEHPGVQDALAADLDGDGQLELYVAFWGIVGAHGVTLDGERLWSNRSVSSALSLVTTPVDDGGFGRLLVTDQSGQIMPIERTGKSDRPILVGSRLIHGLTVVAESDGNGSIYCGTSFTPSGNIVAVGIDREFNEVFSYAMPAGAYENEIRQVTAVRLLDESANQWLLAGPDGSIHLVAADGNFSDRFHYGERLNGLAGARWGNVPALLVSSDSGVTALGITRPAEGAVE